VNCELELFKSETKNNFYSISAHQPKLKLKCSKRLHQRAVPFRVLLGTCFTSHPCRSHAHNYAPEGSKNSQPTHWLFFNILEILSSSF